MSARDHALVQLDVLDLPHWPPHGIPPAIAGRYASPPADQRDRALSEQLSVGVTKNLLHLQWLIAHYTGRRLAKVEPVVQKVLAVALYQLRFLTRIPQPAAVHEAVEQARRFGLARAAGFVNGVLRKALREAAPPPPDPATDPAGHAELALSHPRDVYERLAALIGPQDALRFCAHDNAEPPVIVRLLPGADPAALAADGVTVTPHERPGLFVVEGAKHAHFADWASRAVAQVQDPTSAAAVAHLDLHPGQTVLDRCAGLGTKSVQMREAVGDAGRVLTMDPHQGRARLLADLVARRELANVRVRPVGMMRDLLPEDPQAFNRVLIDAPCSNSGVLPRRPEARYHQDARRLAGLQELQDRILDDTARALKQGGRLVYCTCSVWPEENQARIAAFLERHATFRLVEDRTTWPAYGADAAHYHDGGYLAVLTREG